MMATHELLVEESYADRHVSTRRFPLRRGVRVGESLRRGIAYAVLDYEGSAAGSPDGVGPSAASGVDSDASGDSSNRRPPAPTALVPSPDGDGPSWLVEPGGLVRWSRWMDHLEAGELTEAGIGRGSYDLRDGAVTVHVGRRCFVVSRVPRVRRKLGFGQALSANVSEEGLVLASVGLLAAGLGLGLVVYSLIVDRPAPDDLRKPGASRDFVASLAAPAPKVVRDVVKEAPTVKVAEASKKKDAGERKVRPAKPRKRRAAPAKSPVPKFAAVAPRSRSRLAAKKPEKVAPRAARPLPSFAARTTSVRKTPRGRSPAPGPPPGRGAAPTFATSKFAPSASCIQKAVRSMNAALGQCRPGVSAPRGGGFRADCTGGRATRKGLSFRCGSDRRCTAAEVRTALKTRATRAWWRGLCGG